jgi:hypothetical protein
MYINLKKKPSSCLCGLSNKSRASSSFVSTSLRNYQDPHKSTQSWRERNNAYSLSKCGKCFGMGPQIIEKFWSCTIEIILTGCITAWYDNCLESDRKVLQRIVGNSPVHHWGRAPCHPRPLYQVVSEEGPRNCQTPVCWGMLIRTSWQLCLGRCVSL